MKTPRYIPAGCLVLAAVAAVARAQDAGAPRRPPAGSIAAQLALKVKLGAQAEGLTLASALNHNRQEWENLSPDQRDDYRRNVVAYLNRSPQEQEQLLKHYDELVKMSPEKRADYRRRAKWLKAVTEHMTPAERRKLLEMSPEDRSRELLKRRDELIRQGVIVDEPTSLPASAPTTAPATQGG